MRNERANAPMAHLLPSARRFYPRHLDPGLESYLSSGLALEADGSIVSVAASKAAHAERSRFTDRVEYEAFVNKAHVDDWSGDVLATATIEEKLAHALVIADRVGAWAEERGVAVAVIVSADSSTGDVVFRFHGVRPGERPWLGDLDGYAEPVAVLLYEASESAQGV